MTTPTLPPHIEAAILKIAEENCYHPSGEIVHAMKAAAHLALPKWLPMESCPNDEAILISRDNGSVELVEAIDNDFNWKPYEGPRIPGIDKPNGWMRVPKAKPLRVKRSRRNERD